MSHDMCFCTYVFGWYQDFVPIYIFSILQSFQRVFVKIYLKESLTEVNRKLLGSLPNQSFEIIENYKGVDLTYVDHLPAIRFLLPRKELSDFPYAYIGDVDFIMYDEVGCDFLEYYLRHCDSTGLPFSNSITQDNGYPRLTGLHFIKVQEYYDEMEGVIQQVLAGDPIPLAIRKSPYYDERTLYYMANKTFDLSVLGDYARPHHGIHFGYVRDRAIGHSFAGKTRLKIWLENLDKIEPIIEHPCFLNCYQNMGKRAKSLMDRVRMILYYPLFL